MIGDDNGDDANLNQAKPTARLLCRTVIEDQSSKHESALVSLHRPAHAAR